MSTAAMARSAISRIGEDAVLKRGEQEIRFCASIQPRFSQGGDISGPAGWGGPGRYMLYAPADSPAIFAGDEILCRDSVYHVTRAHDVYLSGELIYRQARLLGEEGGSCKV